jgi:exonuclease VII small subunit
MQFIKPDKNLGLPQELEPFFVETNPSESVREILGRACMDCHSNQTSYPWYNQVAPVSYWIADHVKQGKGHLNFSAWDSYEAKRKDHKLEEVIETVESGEMPLKEYTWTHQGARLTSQERQALLDWAKNTRLLYALGTQPE